MSSLAEFTARLQSGQDLSEADCMSAAKTLPLVEVPASEKKAFLLALHAKGETVEEVTAFARVFRQLASDPELSDVAADAIDIVGTGGSGSQGYNISSTAAIIVAAAGEKVLKHGNRTVTSKSGAADFLSQLGIRMDTDPRLLRQAIEELNFCFFFAPAFHPAFKEIVPVRKELAAEGHRTIFNILGPLVNPAKAAYQLLGVLSPTWVDPLASALHQLGLKRGLAVSCHLSGGGYMDELTTAGENHLSGFGSLSGYDTIWTADAFGFSPARPEEIRGGTAAENVELLNDVLAGYGRPGLVDSLTLNAGAAFLILERVASIREGCALARDVLLGGALQEWLEKARAFYAADTGRA